MKKKNSNRKILLGIVICLFFANTALYAQACASNSPYPWEWPSHQNWFFSNNQKASFAGGVMNISTIVGTSLVSFEGTTAVSDDAGNFLFFSNGSTVWKGTGGTPTYGPPASAGDAAGLHVGRGGTLSNSACQGIITVRHPLDTANYYIFTEDDVIDGAGTHGLNYYTFNSSGGYVAGPVNIFAQTTEGIAATFHSNGVDIWVVVHEPDSRRLHSFLVTCTGVSAVPVSTDGVATDVQSDDRMRGGMAFSADGQYFAEAYGNWGSSTGNDSKITVMSFDNATGIFSDSKFINNVAGRSYYDVEFSPDGKRLYTSSQTGQVETYDLSSWNAATMKASNALVIATGGAHGSLQMGGDGNLYYASAKDSLSSISGNLNTGAVAYTRLVANNNRLGLPNMFLPPQENVYVPAVGPLCDTDLPVNLSAGWLCSGGNVEDPVGNPGGWTATCGACITDAANGIFDPVIAGVGTYTITYTYNGGCAGLSDTMIIVVNDCGVCPDTTLAASIPSICPDGTIDLSLYDGTAAAGNWSIQSGPGILASITGTTFNGNNSTPGNYVVRYTLVPDPGGACAKYAERTLVIKAFPVVDLGADPVLCTDSLFILDATNPGGTYVWTPSGKFTPTDTVKGPGKYKVTVTINGCSVSDSVNVTWNALPLFNFSVTDTKFCANDSAYAIAGSNAYNYLWTPGGSNDTAIWIKAGGNVSVTITNALTGCNRDTSIAITVDALPVVNLRDTVVCVGGKIVLQPSPSVWNGYLWNTGATTDTIMINTPGQDYWVEVTDANGCVKRDSADVSVGDTLHVDFGADQSICANEVLLLQAAQYGPFIKPVKYTWNDGNTTDSTRTIASQGIIGVVVMDGRGCIGSDSVNVTVHALPTVNLGPDTSLCFTGGETWPASVSDTMTSVLWSTGEITKSIIYQSAGDLKVTVTNQFGCSASDTINVSEHCDSTILCFPNIITPNEDGFNDNFHPCKNEMPNITDINFVIYDRWGLRMFESKDVLPFWNGTFNGSAAADGVYYWIVRYTDSTHAYYEVTGWLQVIH